MSVLGMRRRSALGELADELRESVHAFVQSRSPEAEVRRLAETEDGFDAAVWAQMAEQLELPGMTIPERFGGSGFAIDAQVVVFEEMGRALMCTPFLSTVLAAEALVASADDAVCEELLPGIAAGTRRAALALTDGIRDLDVGRIGVSASAPSSGGAVLDGDKKFVIDGHTADLLIVVAREPEGPSVFVVEAMASGVARRSMATLDVTRKQAHITLNGVEARRVGQAGAAEPVIARVLLLAAVAIATESVGCAAACLDMSVQYAKDRVQFGRPIGSFQAVKHKCAEMMRVTEQARAAAYEAAIAMAAESAETQLVASVAKTYCTEMAGWVAAENIQVHGGIGYTWEHPAHLYFRRAKSNEQLFGGPAWHREMVLRCIGI
jgi:alkylation response protein AidB-like acyl-CoA dehydrogenase